MQQLNVDVHFLSVEVLDKLFHVDDLEELEGPLVGGAGIVIRVDEGL